MAITVEERWRSGVITVGEESTATLEYLVFGTDDPAEANGSLFTETPATYQSLPRMGANVTGRVAEEIWAAEVIYGTGGGSLSKLTGTSVFNFDIRSENIRITHAPVIQSAVAAGYTFRDRKGGIGWDGERFEGIDVPTPVYSFSETHYLASAFVTSTYKQTVKSIARNPVNNAAFRGFAAGEVLFLGVSGSLRSVTQWELTFAFQAQENLAGLTIGDITGVNKDGWDYLNVEFDIVKDATAKVIKKIPKQVTVHRPLGRSNFAGLGIGTL